MIKWTPGGLAMHLRRILGGLLAAVVFCGCGDDSHPAMPDHDGILHNLGFNTNLGPATDPSGNPLPSDYNPLRKPYGVFHPKAEICGRGMLWDNGTGNPPLPEVMFEDKSAVSPYSRMTFMSPGDNTWTNAVYKNAIAADIDGDGLDEIFIAYYVQSASELRYIVL